MSRLTGRSRALTLAFLIVGVVSTLPQAARADDPVGVGLSTTWESDPSETPGECCHRSVTGTGTFVIEGGGSTYSEVDYACSALAAYDPTTTVVRPATEDGCQLYKGTTLIDEADGRALPGAFVATSDRVLVNLSQTGALRVCWNVSAFFLNGSRLDNSDCTS